MTRVLLLLAWVSVMSACTENLGPDSQAQKPVTLKYMHMGVSSDGRDSNRYVTQLFPSLVGERFPNIRISTEMLPEEAYTKALLMQLSAGAGPDFFEWWPKRQLEELARAGYLQDLTGLDILNAFSAESLEGFTVDGRVYGFPKGFSMMGAWYNKDLFERYGIRELPKDWPAFLALCETLKSEGITPIVMPDKDWWFLQFGLYPLAASVIYPAEPDFDQELMAGTRTFSGSKWRDVLNMYKLLYDRGYIAEGSLDTGEAQAAAWFNDGRAAMTFGGNWDYGSLTKQGAVPFRRGFMPLPGNAPGEPLLLSVGPAGGTVINKNTDNLPDVLDVMAYQFNPESPLYREYKRQYQVFPALKDEDVGLAEFEAYAKLLKTNETVTFSNQAWPVGVAETLCRGFQDWIAGEGGADDILAAMDRTLERLRGT